MDTKKITILNKLPRQDSVTGLDIWYKSIVLNAIYSIEKVADVQGSITSLGQVFNILIPFNSAYLPYNEWKDSDKESYFTLSQGDLIFIDVDINEDITPQNVQQIKNKYKSSVCEVRSIVEVPKRAGVNYRLKVSGV